MAFWPSMMPCSAKPLRRASTRCSLSLAERALRNPMTGLMEDCAPAASGQAAALPITTRKSRRRMPASWLRRRHHIGLDECISRAEVGQLFDDFIGNCQYRRGHLDTERPCGPEVDDQLQLGRSYDRQFGWLFAIEDTACIDANLVVGANNAGSIADEAASRDIIANGIECEQ